MNGSLFREPDENVVPAFAGLVRTQTSQPHISDLDEQEEDNGSGGQLK